MDHGHHGGDIYRNEIIYDFSININPLGMPEEARRVLRENIDAWEKYPDPECRELRERLSEAFQVPVSWLICGSGAADLIYQLTAWKKPKRALVTAPAFSEYERALRTVGCRVDYEILRKEEQFAVDPDRLADRIDDGIDMVFVCNPNNPTGTMVDGEAFCCLADACERHRALLVIDECFCELSDRPESGTFLPYIGRYPHTMILRAFTKTYAMAGLRLGYGICSSREVMSGLRSVRQPWSISVPAQQAGAAVLGQQEYLQNAGELIRRERKRLKEALEKMGFTVYRSEANYLLFEDRRMRIEDQRTGTENRGTGTEDPGTETHKNLWEQLKDRKILIRDCSNYRGLGEGYYRICVKTPEENGILLVQLYDIMGTDVRNP